MQQRRAVERVDGGGEDLRVGGRHAASPEEVLRQHRHLPDAASANTVTLLFLSLLRFQPRKSHLNSWLNTTEKNPNRSQNWRKYGLFW